MASVGEVAAYLDRLYDASLAESWDNVGLIAGDRAETVGGVVVCLDLSAGVLERCCAGEMAVCYHPPIFRPASRVVAGGTAGLVWGAIRRGVSLYSPHTAADASAGGTGDCMAGLLGLRGVRAGGGTVGESGRVKLVVFCPAESTEKVREACCGAGAGVIGEYRSCAFRSRGRGSFEGSERSQPAVGESGRLEFVEEDRLELLVDRSGLGGVLEAMRGVHPYEEPAYDVYPLLAGRPGAMRVGELERRVGLGAFAEQVEAAWSGAGVRARISVAGERGQLVGKVAVVPGAGGGLVDAVLASEAEVLVTGELSHHDARRLVAGGRAAVCVGHGPSEVPFLGVLRSRLLEGFGDLPVRVDAVDSDPFGAQSAGRV